MAAITIRNALPLSLCRAAEAAFPPPDWQYWHRYTGANANKYGSVDACRIPPACLRALYTLADVVSEDIGDSFIDYDLHGAGLHMMPPGGFLARHLDADRHPIKPWRRTHSIVLSLNDGWREVRGGELVLEGIGIYSPATNHNTAIIFETAEQWHEVNRVGTDISGVYRKTLALFAWTENESDEGSTSATFCSK